MLESVGEQTFFQYILKIYHIISFVFDLAVYFLLWINKLNAMKYSISLLNNKNISLPNTKGLYFNEIILNSTYCNMQL